MPAIFRPALPLGFAVLWLAACSAPLPPATVVGPPDLEVRTLTAGEGPVARTGQDVTVHYTGWFFDPDAERRRGAEFDASRHHGAPFVFRLGEGRVIRGWDEGVAGMRVGEVRELAIPADLAYGARGAGGVIPPHQPLLFEVELLGVADAD